jgi:hypothetical protein
MLQQHGAACHSSTPRSSMASSNTMEQRGILHHHGAPCLPSTPRSSVASSCSVVLEDAKLLVVMKDATLLCGVEGHHAVFSVVSVASSHAMGQRGILQHHGAAWHPSTPRSSVASFEVCHAAPCCWRMPRCSMVLKKGTVLRGVEGCHTAPWS